MRSIAFADFLIGLGILFVLEGLLFAASPGLDAPGHEERDGDAGQHFARGGHRFGRRSA